jgi:hypothetical protein
MEDVAVIKMMADAINLQGFSMRATLQSKE